MMLILLFGFGFLLALCLPSIQRKREQKRESQRVAAVVDHSRRCANSAINEITQDHWRVLQRKRQTMLVADEYGFVDATSWSNELYSYTNNLFIEKYRASGVTDSEVLQLIADLIVESINDRLLKEGSLSNAVSFNARPTDPYEYEHYCAQLLNERGWDAAPTQGSGDQGADVLASNGRETIVIQCKLYSQPVGNKAVQEVYSAKTYYGASQAIVMTNNEYTKSARQLAQSNDVLLLHDSEVAKLDYLLR